MRQDLIPLPSHTAVPGRDAVDLVCFSHLRWSFVYQRPQHLLSRSARDRRVFFVEEPVGGASSPYLEVRQEGPRLFVAVPHLPDGLDEGNAIALQRELLDGLLADRRIGPFIAWYYTPMALKFTRHLAPQAAVYDCMDQLASFKDAPPEIALLEHELLSRVDLVFTGGQSLWEAKRHFHPRVHLFPSSVDFAHFARARSWQGEPADQAAIPGPRIGYAGVIDERLDLDLLHQVALGRPDWQLVLLGPVVKIDPALLPRLPNVHYLGMKAYLELPAYLAGWDVAMLPFARNEATRFISPTKTPEYLAAGRRVVSTSIRDVVRPYKQQGLVEIADEPAEFIAAVEGLLADRAGQALWQLRVDTALAAGSWDQTHAAMWRHVEIAAAAAVEAMPDLVPIEGARHLVTP